MPRSIRERQLLEVAEKAFAVWGYQGASLERVARDAGVTRQYLTKLFGDKEELYLACHARARDQLDEMMAASAAGLSDDPTPEDARGLLRACAEAYFTFVRSHGSGWDVLFGGGAAVAGPAAAEVERMRFDTVALLAGLVRLAGPEISERDSEMFAHAMSGAGEQLAKWWRRNDVPLEVVVERYVSLFWDGLAQLAGEA